MSYASMTLANVTALSNHVRFNGTWSPRICGLRNEFKFKLKTKPEVDVMDRWYVGGGINMIIGGDAGVVRNGTAVLSSVVVEGNSAETFGIHVNDMF